MNIIEKILGVRIVKKGKVALIFEEVHLQRFFEHYRVDCVFDVGANNGQYATMLRKNIGYKGPIISYEPIPAAATLLRSKSNADPQWYIEQLALDASVGKASFNIMRGAQFSSLHMPSESEVDLFQDKNSVVEKISVETSTLRDMLEKYRKLIKFKRPFLKMDTQGNDLEIARSAGNDLASFIGLQSELSVKKLYEDTTDYKKVIDYYTSQGFELSAFVPNNEGHFPRLIEIDCIMYNKNFAS